MKVKPKIHIKHMFAFKPRKSIGVVYIAMLTDANQYIEYQIEFRQSLLTKYVCKRIRSLFEPYSMTSSTDIMVNELLDEDHPLYLYFMILHQQIGFKLGVADINKAINRIHYYFNKKRASKSKLNAVWKKAIEQKTCPWITQAIDYQVQNKGPTMAYRIKALRLYMLYIVVKNHLYALVKKSIKKRHGNPTDV